MKSGFADEEGFEGVLGKIPTGKDYIRYMRSSSGLLKQASCLMCDNSRTADTVKHHIFFKIGIEQMN